MNVWADPKRDKSCEASGEAEGRRTSRLEFQKLMSAKLKKVNPMVKCCVKTSERKGVYYRSIHRIAFHDETIPTINLRIDTDKYASLSFLGAAPHHLDIELADSKKAFEKLEGFIKMFLDRNYKPVLIDCSEVFARFDIDAFRIENRVDQINEPTTIAPSDLSRRDLLAVFTWAKANETKLQKLSYHQLLIAMRKDTGVWGHTYCAID